MMDDLAMLQGWMQAAILKPEAGVGTSVTQRVRGDQKLGAEARLEIYARSYWLRLLECLCSEYPILKKLVGPTVFELFARGYCAASPSQSYTLYEFGAGFADYLEQARPRGDGTPGAIEAIPAALARIERATAEVLRAHGVEDHMRPATGQGIDPFIANLLGLAGASTYALPDSVRLLALPFDFIPLLSAAEREEPLALPIVAPSFMAVCRVRYRVEYHPLAAWQLAWLTKLPHLAVTSGAPFATDGDARLEAWLPFAVSHGLVIARNALRL